jgi:hypothetical protein
LFLMFSSKLILEENVINIKNTQKYNTLPKLKFRRKPEGCTARITGKTGNIEYRVL